MPARLGRLTLALMLFAMPASGQLVRSFVSVSGTDDNPCTRSSPCRNFDAAVAAVDPGGEVVVLDSGGYGPVTLSKSVALIAPSGLHAAIAPTIGSAILVDGSLIRVIVRNLYLNSRGGTIGIDLQRGRVLFLEGLVVRGFSTGINLRPINPPSPGQTYVRDSVASSNGTGLRASADVASSSRVYVDRSAFEDNGTGVAVQEGGEVHIRDSMLAGNRDEGATVISRAAGRVAEMTAYRCSFLGNSFYGLRVDGREGPAHATVIDSIIANGPTNGVSVGGDGTLRLGGTTITRNFSFGLSGSGTVNTIETNFINGNGTDISPSLTIIPVPRI